MTEKENPMQEPRENDATPEEIEAHERELEASVAEHEEQIAVDPADYFGMPDIETRAETPSDGWLTEAETAETPDDETITERDLHDPDVEQARDELEVESWPEDLPSSPEEAAAVPMMEAPPLQVLVVGSYGWTNSAIIGSVLQPWIEQHSARRIVVATSGMPHGAEMFAAAYAQQLGAEVTAIRDEQIVPGMFAHAFAFILNKSEGAQQTLGRAYQAGVPVTRIAIDEEPARTPWSNR